MRAMLWAVALCTLGLWSTLAWAGHAMLPVVAGWVAGAPTALGAPPAAAEPVAAFVAWSVPMGEWLVTLLWAAGALLILAAPAVLARAIRAARQAVVATRRAQLGWHPASAARARRRRPRRGTPLDWIARRIARRHRRLLLELRPQ
jgi:hypothetical protein